MSTPQVLVIDDNQTFGQQVVAAFGEVGLPAVWAARAGDAIALLERLLTEASGPPSALLCVVDLVRPASGGRVFLGHLHGSLQALLVARGCQPTCLSLVPVIGSFHDLPEGVEVQVKPIFPSQVVSTGRRLLGLTPAVSGRPLSGVAPGAASGVASGVAPGAASGRAAMRSSPGLPIAKVGASGGSPALADSTIQLDTVDELTDFGPSDTVLMPLQSLPGTNLSSSNMEELARSLSLGGSDPALLSVSATATMAASQDDLARPARANAANAANQAAASGSATPASARPRTRPQFAALPKPATGGFMDDDAAAATVAHQTPQTSQTLGAAGLPDPSDVHTVPFSRTMPLPSLLGSSAESGPYASLSVEPAQNLAQASAALHAQLRPTATNPAPAPATPSTATADLSSGEALRGDLAVIPLVDVLGMLARQRQTGRLRIGAPAVVEAGTAAEAASSQHIDIEVFLRVGRIDFAQATGRPALRLGPSILTVAALQGRDLDEAAGPRAAVADPDENLLGQRLLRAGLLRPEELRQALARQCNEILRYALSLQAGRFLFLPCRDVEFPRRARDPAIGGSLSLDAEALVLAGYRSLRDRLHATREVEEAAVYLSTVTGSGPLSRLGLSDTEVAVLMLCNGRLTAADLARESHLPLSDVLLALGRLQSLRLCRRRLPALLAS